MMARFLSLFLSLGAIAFIVSCGPQGAPSVPGNEPVEGTGPTPDSPGELDPNADPFDATVAHRLTALPQTVQNKVKDCEAGGKFYDLGDQACTELVPTTFPCVINDAFKALIDPSTLAPLDDYLATKANTHRLYACTDDGTNITLHFYKFEDGVVNYKKLKIAKKVM